MRASAGRDSGFTLVELMVVVLIIGVLVSIAVPVYQSASVQAQMKGCLANQRSIEDAVALYLTDDPAASTALPGQLISGGSGWYAALVPGWLKSTPRCPLGQTSYFMDTFGHVVGDQGALPGFKGGHALP